ncbi:MAG TPA: hypothetical protein VGD67_06750 [Pseudonocardiaceae bacterium]
MADPAGHDDQPVLYAEPGSTWWPLAWGPALALVGVMLDALSGHAVQVWLWLPVAVLFTLISAVSVSARRKVRRVLLTPEALHQGRERLAVAEIESVGEAGVAMGAPVLGGSWLVPNGTDGLPLLLRDGRSVLAWARDVEAFEAALRRIVDPGDAAPGPGGRPDGPGDSADSDPDPVAG